MKSNEIIVITFITEMHEKKYWCTGYICKVL